MTYYLVMTILLLDILSVVTVVFFERKNPASSLAWILLLCFLPVFGFFIYLFFGSGYRFRVRRRYAKKSMRDEAYEDTLLRHLQIRNRFLFGTSDESRVGLLRYLENEGDGCYTDDNEVEVFTDGNDMFPRLIDDIRAAKKHVHLLFYIFKNDCVGGEIIAALRERVRDGVEVRLVYDGVGSLLSYGHLFAELRRDGGKVRVFAPVFGKLSSSIRVNYRNHRKIVVIDGEIGYVGGMNVGDEYMGRNPKLSPWRDTHARLTGSAVWFLQERFFMDWSHVSGREFTEPEKLQKYFPPSIGRGHLGVQLAGSGPDRDTNPIKGGILRMFYGARKTLYVQTPYFAPDQSVIDAMQVAASTGVDVRLMIPQLADRKFVRQATYGYARQILDSGVRVFMYHGFLHAKTVVADARTATLGTANLSNRSFTQNFEVNLFVHDERFAAEQEAIFQRDLENSTELTEEWFTAQPLLNRVLYNSSRLLSPLI